MPDDVSAAEQARRDGLAVTAAELKGEVGALKLAVEQLGERTGRAERASFRTMLFATVLLVVVALLGWVVWQQSQTNGRLEQLVQRSLCPVYGLAVGGYDPSTRPAGPARDKYNQGFAVMRDAYAELHCSVDSLIPKRQDS